MAIELSRGLVETSTDLAEGTCTQIRSPLNSPARRSFLKALSHLLRVIEHFKDPSRLDSFISRTMEAHARGMSLLLREDFGVYRV